MNGCNFLKFEFIKKCIYLFFWRVITLQYCGGFCHTSTWIIHGCTCVPPSWTPLPPPFLPHPSGLSQSTSFGCLDSHIEFVLVIYFTYGNIHVSMLFSHIVPPSPSPTESKSLFILSVSFAVSHIGHRYHLSKFHIYALVYTVLCFSFWLTSLCIIGSSFIHLIRTDSTVYFLMAE